MTQGEANDPSPLFTPFDLGGVTLRNRFVMSPMTRGFSPGGVPGEDVASYYRRRAAHVGLIVTEATYVDHPSASWNDRVPRVHGTDALAGWRRAVRAVHEEGGSVFPQLSHVGAARDAGARLGPGARILSPSGVAPDGSSVGPEATADELADVVASFARAAADAQRTGFDGVEIHGGHGFLLDQFLWPKTNRRRDAYGGGIAGRVRLSTEVVAAVRDAVGPGYPIVFRFSQWKGSDFDARVAETPRELEGMLVPLVDAGVSAFHASTRRYWLPAFEGESRTLAGWTKRISGLPTIALGSVGVSSPFGGSARAEPHALDLAPLLRLFERREFDLVAVGRAILSDPEWPTKVREHRHADIRPYRKQHETELQ